MWLRVGPTNNDPYVILGYYLDRIKQIKGNYKNQIFQIKFIGISRYLSFCVFKGVAFLFKVLYFCKENDFSYFSRKKNMTPCGE